MPCKKSGWHGERRRHSEAARRKGTKKDFKVGDYVWILSPSKNISKTESGSGRVVSISEDGWFKVERGDGMTFRYPAYKLRKIR